MKATLVPEALNYWQISSLWKSGHYVRMFLILILLILILSAHQQTWLVTHILHEHVQPELWIQVCKHWQIQVPGIRRDYAGSTWSTLDSGNLV